MFLHTLSTKMFLLNHSILPLLTIVEPVPKTIKTILYKVLGCSKVEPRIDCGGG